MFVDLFVAIRGASRTLRTSAAVAVPVCHFAGTGHRRGGDFVSQYGLDLSGILRPQFLVSGGSARREVGTKLLVKWLVKLW